MMKKLMVATTLIALSSPAFALLNSTTNNDNSVTNAPIANGGNASAAGAAAEAPDRH